MEMGCRLRVHVSEQAKEMEIATLILPNAGRRFNRQFTSQPYCSLRR